MAKKVKEEKTGLDAMLAQLEEKYGMKRSPITDLTIVNTGSVQLNRAMVIGGTALGKIIEVFGEESSGKAQPLSSKILTPTGWITMGDVELGTIISTPDGKNSTVIGVFPQGEQDVYKITFDDKTTTKCTLDHLWFVNVRGSKLGDVLSCKELLSIGLKKANGCRKFRIPMTAPIEYEQYGEITINPYLLGLLLGDGGFTDNNLKITLCDEELVNNVKNIIKEEYKDVILSDKMGNCGYTFRKNNRGGKKCEILEQIIELGLFGKYSYEKYVPKQYLYTSIENRIALLQGLMDSDGCAFGGTPHYSTTSAQMSKDFEELVRGLGMRCSTSSRVTQYTSPTGNKVDGRLSYGSSLLFNSLEFKPFRLKRKLDQLDNKKSFYSERYIENIELIGREECQCIMIGHPDQLYITDDFIVTHNTTVTLHQIAEYQKAFPNKKVALMDFEHSFDPRYAKAIGVDVDNLLIYQPDNLESGYNMVVALIEKDIVSCVVIDSQTAAAPKAIIDGEMGDSTIGLQARLNSKFCLKIKGLISVHRVTLFVISQTRNNIGSMGGDPNITTGGKAWKFYADVRWKIWKMNDKANELNKTTIDVIKSKVGVPYGQAKVNILWGVGFDTIGEIVEYAHTMGIVSRAGTWYSYGETKLGQGMEKTRELLKDNPELFEEIREKVMSSLSPDLINTEIEIVEEEETNESN